MSLENSIIETDATVLVTGATGFVGIRVVERLLAAGFRKIRCFVRPSSDVAALRRLVAGAPGDERLEVVPGNLQSRADCLEATRGVAVVYHLAVGAGGKSFPDLFMNSVLTTRNLLEGCVQHGTVKRFVNVSSLAVYSNCGGPSPGLLDESASIDAQPWLRGEAYCYAKLKQDEVVAKYGREHGLPYVICRPGVVYGPGKTGIVGRVGLGTFGVFLHLGGGNRLPLTYVDNCADAIVLAGIRQGVEGEIFNVIDDDLPTSRRMLRLYKRNVARFRSLYVPRFASYLLFWCWEKYSLWSAGQLPPTFNRRAWRAYWKGSRYSNAKAKARLGWTPRVSTREGILRYLENCRKESARA